MIIGLTHHPIDGQPRKDQIETVKKLQFSSENLLKLINDILDYSKMESRKPELEDSIFNLKNIGENQIAGLQSLAQEKQISILLNYDRRLNNHIGARKAHSSIIKPA